MQKTNTTPELKPEDVEVLKTKSVQDLIKAEVARLMQEKEKELEEKANQPRVFKYSPTLTHAQLIKERVKNNDRVTNLFYSKHFSKIRGAYTQFSVSLFDYNFSEGKKTWILDEHMPVVVEWLEEEHYVHGDAIEQDPSLLAALEAWYTALAVK